MVSYELPVIGIIQAQSASDYLPSSKAHCASRARKNSLCCLLHKNKQTAKDLSMFEKSLRMKGRDRKRQTATRKLQEADNAQSKGKLKQKKSNNQNL